MFPSLNQADIACRVAASPSLSATAVRMLLVREPVTPTAELSGHGERARVGVNMGRVSGPGWLTAGFNVSESRGHDIGPSAG